MTSKSFWYSVTKAHNNIRRFLAFLAPRTPTFLKPIFRPIYRPIIRINFHINRILGIIAGPKSREEQHEYWKHCSAKGNLLPIERSLFLVEIIKRYVTTSASILEIGCSVGRNLNYLLLNGFQNLAGNEINESAIRLLEQSYPKLAEQAVIYNESAEEALGKIPSEEFTLVFTMAVLQHIHPSSEFIFDEIARITGGYLITIEIEHLRGWCAFPRNYKTIFESLGFKQVEEIDCSGVRHLGAVHTARVFEKCKEGIA